MALPDADAAWAPFHSLIDPDPEQLRINPRPSIAPFAFAAFHRCVSIGGTHTCDTGVSSIMRDRLTSSSPMPRPPRFLLLCCAPRLRCPVAAARACEASSAPGNHATSHTRLTCPERTMEDFTDIGPLCAMARSCTLPWSPFVLPMYQNCVSCMPPFIYTK